MTQGASSRHAAVDPTPAATESPSEAPAIELEFATGPDHPTDAELAARAHTTTTVAVADQVVVVGHIEAVDGDALIVAGRRVRTELATLDGGGRPELVVQTLVRVSGQGAAEGTVLAERIEIFPGRDPAEWAKLVQELAKFQEKFWKKAKRYEDPALDRYLAQIARRLLPAYVPEPERAVEIIVVQNPDLNAFALPDGNIVLHTGIIARMDNEAQLASVIGHEMAHYTQRHTLRAIDKSTEHQVIGWGSLLAALALGVSGKGDAAQGVRLMSSAWLSGYSRNHEDEADQIGLRYMYLAGYDVREAAKVWRTFRLLYGAQSREANFFYGSHSIAEDREHHLDQEVWKAYEPSGLVGGEVGAARFLRATSAMVRDNALYDLERGNLAWAEWGLAKSLAVDPDSARTHVALATLRQRAGSKDALRDALGTLNHALALDPECAEAHRELGELRQRMGDPAGAKAAFERYLELRPEAEDAVEIRRRVDRI